MKITKKIILIGGIILFIFVLFIVGMKLYARTGLSARCDTLRSRDIPTEIERHEAEDEYGSGSVDLCSTGFYGKRPDWTLKERTSHKTSGQKTNENEVGSL